MSDSPTGPCYEFKKHVYELIQSNNYVLIHYLGNEKTSYHLLIETKKATLKEQPFIRTCASTIVKLKNECKTFTAKKVYRNNVMTDHETSYQAVFQPKNCQQVENLRNKYLKQQKISHDSLYNIHGLAIDLPEFVHKIETHLDLLCICGHNGVLEARFRIPTTGFI